MACCKNKKTTTTKKTQSKCCQNCEDEVDFGEEFRALAQNLKEHLAAAWNSEQKQKAEAKVSKGFDMMVKGINQVIDEAKKGTLNDKVKNGIHKVLKDANSKLEKSKKVWKPAKKK